MPASGLRWVHLFHPREELAQMSDVKKLRLNCRNVLKSSLALLAGGTVG